VAFSLPEPSRFILNVGFFFVEEVFNGVLLLREERIKLVVATG
jgi:hypothetical protein